MHCRFRLTWLAPFAVVGLLLLLPAAPGAVAAPAIERYPGDGAGAYRTISATTCSAL
jgi:hypothetical protein